MYFHKNTDIMSEIQKLTEEKFTLCHKIFAMLRKKCYFCLSNYYLKPNKVNYYTNNEKLS